MAQFSRYLYYYLARHLAEIPSLKRTKGILAGSATTREEFINAYGISPKQILLARHSIGAQFSRRQHVEQLQERIHLAPGDGVRIIVSGSSRC